MVALKNSHGYELSREEIEFERLKGKFSSGTEF